MARSQRRDVISALFSLSRSNSTNGGSSILPRSRSGSITSGGGSKIGAATAAADAATAGHNYPDVYEQLVEEQQQSFFGGDTHTSASVAGDPRHRTSLQPQLVAEDDWAAMQAVMDGGGGGERHAKHGWEQYADLGGLTEVR